MEWYHVWWPWLTSKCVARFVSDSWVSCSIMSYFRHIFLLFMIFHVTSFCVIVYSFVVVGAAVNIFYPRDVVKGVLATATCLAGWLAGCPSHAGIVSKRLTYLKTFRPSESPIILVSWDSCTDTQFYGQPLQWGGKYTGVGKLAIFVRFSTDIAVYLGNGAR